jgi:hypothetical protein
MKKLLPLTFAMLAAGCVVQEPMETSHHDMDHSGGAAALAGFTPGSTRSCIPTRGLQGNRDIGDGRILFERSPGQVFVTQTRSGCRFNRNHALVFTSTQAQLCSGEAVRIVDTASGANVDNCILGEFTEYRR